MYTFKFQTLVIFMIIPLNLTRICIPFILKNDMRCLLYFFFKKRIYKGKKKKTK